MSPGDFSFNLTIPVDARFVAVVRELTLQAATYANLTQADSRALADRVAAEAGAAAPPSCALHYRCNGDRLSVTVNGKTFSEPIIL